MKPLTLGIDTSCYTTSLAVVDENKVLLTEEKKPLIVKQGQRGLQQSDGFFQHVANLPVLLEKIKINVDIKKIGALSVSSRPRNQEGSYMPVFMAGFHFAKTLSASWDIPLWESTHQEGHIMASAMDCGFDYRNPHLAVHLSGGTTEILLVKWAQNGFSVKIVGKSLDISAGQLLDRVGVSAGLAFPCGKTLDELSIKAKNPLPFPLSMKEANFHFSGAESWGMDYVEKKENLSNISAGLFSLISKTLSKSLKIIVRQTGQKNVLMAGGVSASLCLKENLKHENSTGGPIFHFASIESCTDNARGIAFLGSSFRK